MKKEFSLAIVMALSAFPQLDRPAVAAPRDLPWCVQSRDGADRCSYYTFKQCRDSARGDGTCSRNPRFDGYYFERGLPAPVDVDPFGRPLPARRR